MSEPRVDLWLANLRDERDGAALYEGLARIEKDPQRAQTFQGLADGERRHAAIWQRKLEAAGSPLPPDRPSRRVRAILWLARRLGTSAVLSLVADAEAADADKYTLQGGDAAALAPEEREHREVLNLLAGNAPSTPQQIIGARERWHRIGGTRTGNLRAAVFGMNDGLVSNVSLVLGVAAAGAGESALIVTGLAGLLAGACSMAVGEYVSVASQRDIHERQIQLERRELEEAPEEEAAELALILKQKGVSTEQAARTARELTANPDAALDTLVREELGLDPANLGSPVAAALSSFVMFAVGATLPILPFFVMKGHGATFVSGGLCAVVLAGVGTLMGFLSGTSPLRSAARMVGLATLAAGITVGVGRLVGATLS